VLRRSAYRWAIPVAVGMVIGSLIAWWMWTARPGTDEVAAAQPIAIITAPDYHALLIGPVDANHVLFGSHEGTQESRDGGRTWQAGSLRGVDAMILTSSPEAPETIYAAGHDVFHVSRDGGDTWQPVTHNLPGTDIHGFAQDPEDPQRLYAFVVGAGVLTSGDGGASWAPLPTQPPGGSYVVLAASGDELYAATDAGIASSQDRGQTWSPLETQPGKVTVLSLAVSVSDPELIYVGTPSGAFRSTDGGSSWDHIGPSGVAVLAIALAPDDAGQVLMLDDGGAVYRSDDTGITWHSAVE
jgi:photosystem II stability/assembly factor-like uncharacterized protein